MYSKWMGSLAALLALAGCEAVVPGAMNAVLTDAAIAQKTAQYFGTTENLVQVYGFQRGSVSTSYGASYNGMRYQCSIHTNVVRCEPLAAS